MASISRGGLGVTVEIEQTADQFTPTLMGIERRMESLTELYGDLYTAFRRIEEKRFDAQGPGWTALASSTVADRVSLGIGGDHPILNRNGASYEGRTGGQLRRSVTTKGAKNAVITPEVDGVSFGTKDPIAGYHQYGTRKMPQRALIDLTEDDAEVFSGIISDWFFYGPEGAPSGTFATVAGAI